jgi:hypothetical protein
VVRLSKRLRQNAAAEREAYLSGFYEAAEKFGIGKTYLRDLRG